MILKNSSKIELNATQRIAVRSSMNALAPAALICFVQAALMLAYTATFLWSARAATFIFHKLYFFHDYVPILYRNVARRGAGDLHAHFAIDLFNVILQCIVLILLGLTLYRNIRGRRPDRYGLKKNLLFVALFLFLLVPSYDIFFGLSGVGLFSAIYVTMLTVPVFNFLIYFFLYARFWESYYEGAWLGRRAASPLENAIRQTDSER